VRSSRRDPVFRVGDERLDVLAADRGGLGRHVPIGQEAAEELDGETRG